MRRIVFLGTNLAFLVMLVLMISHCSELADPLDRPGGGDASSVNCITCHTDEATLRAVADPDTSEGEDPGEG